MSLRSPRPGLATLVMLGLSVALVVCIARRSVVGAAVVVAIAATTRVAGAARGHTLRRRSP